MSFQCGCGSKDGIYHEYLKKNGEKIYGPWKICTICGTAYRVKE